MNRMLGSPGPALLAALGVLLLIAAPASGAEKTLETTNAKAMAELMKDWGYKAKIIETTNGRGAIQSSTSQINFVVTFYDCEKPTVCDDLQFVAFFGSSYGGTVQDANKWNSMKRFAVAYYDESDDTMTLNMDLTFKGGVSKKYVEEYINLWGAYLAGFRSFLSAAH